MNRLISCIDKLIVDLKEMRGAIQETTKLSEVHRPTKLSERDVILYKNKRKNIKEKDNGAFLQKCRKEFELFWSAYPARGDPPIRAKKKDAWAVWQKLNPPLNTVLKALEFQKSGWTDSKYIPMACVWLRGQRWLDEVVQRHTEPTVRDTQDPETARLIKEFAEKKSMPF